MFTAGITVTVERSTPGGRDVYGDPIPGTVATHTIEGCAVAPRMSGDAPVRARTGIVVGVTLIAPPGADIVTTDIVVIDTLDPMAGRYTVEGLAGEWKAPWSGWLPGVQVALTRAEG